MEPLRPGDPTRVGEYRLLRRLGAGGMGEVYLGRSPGGRTVAVKLVRGEYAADQEFRTRFRQEVAAARRVGGQWTAPVLDADTDSDHPWVATGYVAGPPLGAAVREFGPLPAPVVRALGAGLAETLHHVHGTGLVHRDIKPSNVLLALDGPRLIDFGIARALDAATALTQSGFVVGSPGFMSPEQAHGRPAGPPGDVFSLGAVLAYAATGIAPFGEGVSAAVLLYRVLHEPPELGDLDGELRELILGCLAKRPEDRPTPAELQERLRAGLDGTVRLGRRGWLPGAVSESVARLAVELLNLDADRPDPAVPAGSDAPGEQPATDGTPGAAAAGGPAHRTPADHDHPLTAPGTGRVGGEPPAASPAAAATASGGEAAPDASTGPAQPAARPPGTGRRRAAPLAAAVVAVIVTAGATLWLTHRGGDPAGHSSDQAGGKGSSAASQPAASPPASSAQPSPSASPSPSGPPTAQGAVPAAFLGTWEGRVVPTTGSYKGTPVVYRVQLAQGRIGDVVGHGSTAFEADEITCAETETLSTATADTVVLDEYTTPSAAGCQAAVGLQVTFKLNPDGSLQFTQKDFEPGTLARAH